MSKDDINNLGSVYGSMLNGLKKDLIKEGKIGPGDIGEVGLQDGGPQSDGGYAEAEIDIEKLSDKEKKDNLYNINKLSYTNDYMPEEDEEGVSPKQEVLNNIKQAATNNAGQFSSEAASMLNSAEDYYDLYRSRGDEDRASICRSLMNHYNTILRGEEGEEDLDDVDKFEEDDVGELSDEDLKLAKKSHNEDEEGRDEDPMYGVIRAEVEHMMKLSGDSAREVFDPALEQIGETLWQYKEYDVVDPSVDDGIALALKFAVDRGMELDEAQQQLEDSLYSYRFEYIFGSSEDNENKESSQISEKIARDSLNNFMKQKSVFDKLYDKVMVNENFDEMESEDFDALGLDDATPDDELEGEGDEITVTLSKDVAQALCDVLQAAMGESDDEDGDEFGAGDEGPAEGGMDFEEDEEGIDTGSTMSTKYDDGKSNKVGDLSPKGAASHKGANIKLDNGSNLKTAYNDGKSNKVGSLTKGNRLVD